MGGLTLAMKLTPRQNGLGLELYIKPIGTHWVRVLDVYIRVIDFWLNQI